MGALSDEENKNVLTRLLDRASNKSDEVLSYTYNYIYHT